MLSILKRLALLISSAHVPIVYQSGCICGSGKGGVPLAGVVRGFAQPTQPLPAVPAASGGNGRMMSLLDALPHTSPDHPAADAQVTISSRPLESAFRPAIGSGSAFSALPSRLNPARSAKSKQDGVDICKFKTPDLAEDVQAPTHVLRPTPQKVSVGVHAPLLHNAAGPGNSCRMTPHNFHRSSSQDKQRRACFARGLCL